MSFRKLAQFASLAPVLMLVAILALSAASGDTLIVQVADGQRIGELSSKYGFSIQKAWTSGKAPTFLVRYADPAVLKDKLKGEAGVLWVEQDRNLSLVQPQGETVLPLGPVTPTVSTDTIQNLLSETVLPLGETVIPLTELTFIQSSYANLARLVAPIQRLILQPSFRKISLYPASFQATGRGIIVADLDTGADTCHEALAGVTVISFVGNERAPEDCPTAATVQPPGYGHGTAVASLIRALAPEAAIWSLRVFDSTGTAQISTVYDAILYAADHGVHVINMSFGTDQYSQALDDAASYAASRGVVLSAASGNSNLQQLLYPSALDPVMATASTDLQDFKAAFSNYHPRMFVSAPGVRLWTAYPNHMLAVASGTSFSSALVAGEAALVFEAYGRNSRLRPSIDNVRRSVAEGVDPIKDPDILFQGKLGSGRINLLKAVLTALKNSNTQ